MTVFSTLKYNALKFSNHKNIMWYSSLRQIPRNVHFTSEWFYYRARDR